MTLKYQTFFIFLTAALLSACSSSQIYTASQGWKQQECEKIMQGSRRAACLDSANMPYKNYQETIEQLNEQKK